MDKATRTVANALIEGIPLAVFVIDPKDCITLINKSALDLFPAAETGRHYLTLCRQPQLTSAIESVQATKKTQRIKLTLATGAENRVFNTHIEPFQGLKKHLIVTLFDQTAFTSLKQIRRDFVANVSHELRTPLTALSGFIETLQGSARDDPAARDRFLQIMSDEIARMDRLVDDLLVLSHAEAEEHRRPDAVISLCATIKQTILVLEKIATQEKITIDFSPPDTDFKIMGVSDQLIQVFQNLLENAIKHGGAGKKITLSISLCAHDIRLRCAAIRVDIVDQGNGIDPIHLPRLTERFFRVDTHRSREVGGTGLGLAIVKHIVQRHKGRLEISSTPGAGATVSVFFPALQ